LYYSKTMTRVAINGFGRIGRLVFRIAMLSHRRDIEIVAINTSGSMEVSGWAHLVNFDTTYRRYEIPISSEKIKSVKEITDEDPLIGYLLAEDIKIPVLAQKDPFKLPWSKYQVDVVIEATGKFTDEEGAKKHAIAGARRVVISAPAKGGNVGTFVLGVNEDSMDPQATVISNASCTTNCAAPVAAVMHSRFGVIKAALTTVHGYTDDQNLQDNSHKDLRRARAAGANIVPTTTGAAVATTETIPSLKGLFDGISLRVPVITGSISDFVFLLSRKVTVDEVKEAFKIASNSPLYKGILGVSEEPLVSSDIIGNSYSAIVDLPFIQVIDGDLVKVLAWYDNEWGYANRLVEQVVRVGESLTSTTVPTDTISQQFK
jgi:glyceraldehyde 3-phosphate dehydrogenase